MPLSRELCQKIEPHRLLAAEEFSIDQSTICEDLVTKGLCGYYFRTHNNKSEQSSLADRLRSVSEEITLTPAQITERATLEILYANHMTEELFTNCRYTELKTGFIANRNRELATQAFQAKRLPMEALRTVAGLARLSAEDAPSEASWGTAARAAIETTIAIFDAQASAEEAIASEPHLAKLRKSLTAPLLGRKYKKQHPYIEHGGGYWISSKEDIIPDIVTYMLQTSGRTIDSLPTTV